MDRGCHCAWRRGGWIKKSRRGGMLEVLNLGQGSGVSPDSVEAVLRSRLGQTAGNCRLASWRREPACCRNRLLTGYNDPESGPAAETLFFNRRLSFQRLLLVGFPNCNGYVPSVTGLWSRDRLVIELMNMLRDVLQAVFDCKMSGLEPMHFCFR
jgi:hypothetical protein